ncbi:hypothetical protein DW790_05450 [Firmicutes bacterium AM31-12AC]|nr:hypothetical protein DW790_05450 [Firmicutes bacterium AM31-12AC]
MAGIGRIYVTAVRNVGDINLTHQYDVDIRFDIAFDWSGKNLNGAKFWISCDGQDRSGTATFNIPSGGADRNWQWGNIGGTQTFRITMPNSGQAKTIGFSATINTDVNPPTISASGSYQLSAVTWQHTVSYNANGGSGAPKSQTKTYGSVLTLSSQKPTREGYTFQGWSTSDSGSVNYSPGGKYEADNNITLYAVWKINTFTVSFDANGGSGAPGSQTKTYGKALTLSSTIPTRTNYNFKGWATSKDASSASYSAGGTYNVNSSITLYAVWELAYWAPKVRNIALNRCNSDGSTNEYGEYSKVIFDWECCQIIGTNPVKSITVGYAQNGTSSYTNSAVSASGNSGKSSTIIGNNALSVENEYMIRITVSDTKGGSGSINVLLNKAAFIMDILYGGKGIAIGKPAEQENLFDVNFNALFRKGAQFLGTMSDATGCPITNGIALYQEPCANPDTTLYETIVTNKGTGDLGSGFWYIRTIFINGRTTNTNRVQYAYPYDSDNQSAFRYYLNGKWSPWIKHDSVVAEGTSGNWYYKKYANGWAEIWGYITTTTANNYTWDGSCKVQVYYPFTFVGQVRYFASFGSNSDAWASLRYVTSSTTMIEAYGKRNDNSNGKASWFNFYVAGQWK